MTRQDPTTTFDGLLEGLILPHQLRPYQEEGIKLLLQEKSVLLADEMGLGKTAQVIIAIRILLEKRLLDRILIVIPRVLRANWKMEFEVWAPDVFVRQVTGNQATRTSLYYLPPPVIIATYDQIRLDSDELDGCSEFSLVVLDEAQTIKNISSRTSLACRALPRQRAWALTGTPIENRVDDLVSIFSFVRPGLLWEDMTREELQDRIQVHFMRRTKKEELPGMPPIIEQELELELEGCQRETYDKLLADKHNTPDTHLFALITKLKQVCNRDPQTDTSVKLEALQVLLANQSLPSDKVVVFSQYVETLTWLSDCLGPISRVFHGQQNDKDQQDTLRWFKKEPGPSVLLMSLKAGGIGLNLQEASLVVLFDRWWNPATEQQAIHRGHRLGRSSDLHVVKFLVKNTIEERIEQILNEKGALFQDIVEHAKSADPNSSQRNILRDILGIVPQIATPPDQATDKE